MTAGEKFFAKYRGVVRDNADPDQRGRVKLVVSDVYDNQETGWAEPCVPYAGNGVGLFAVPPVGANVWVEFERGEIAHPIWSGCFWAQGEAPINPEISNPAIPGTKVFKTDVGTITLGTLGRREEGTGIKIETSNGMKIVINANGIEINNGQNASIKLSGAQVSINGNALEVT